jgi:hypothetical protein
MQASQHHQPGFLSDLLRNRPILDVQRSQSNHADVVALDQGGKHGLIAGAQCANQACLVFSFGRPPRKGDPKQGTRLS